MNERYRSFSERFRLVSTRIKGFEVENCREKASSLFSNELATFVCRFVGAMKVKTFFLYVGILFGTFFFLGFSSISISAQQYDFTVVIDAGHGGKDFGARRYGVNEKDVNLAVALQTGATIKARFPKVKVLYTRSSDVFVGLMDRANFANRNKANLFISIHSNSAENSSARGTETYVLGLWRSEDNLRVAMRENQSITLESDYKTRYKGFDPSSAESYIIFEMMQNRHLDQSIDLAQNIQSQFSKLPLMNRGVRQAGFLVIREIAMPGVLVELGFVSNKSESEYLSSAAGQKALSTAIANGFANYYATWSKKQGKPIIEDRSATVKAEETEETPEVEEEDPELTASAEPVQPVKETNKKTQVSSSKRAGTIYRIQIASSKQKKNPKKDAFFNGLNVRVEKKGSMYCYMVEETTDLNKAKQLLKKHRKHYKDAFIVVYKGGKRVKDIY